MELMDDRLIHEVRQEASRKINREIELEAMEPISMHGWLRLPKKCPESVGVSSDIFKQMRVQDLHSDKINGVIISNPPWRTLI